MTYTVMADGVSKTYDAHRVLDDVDLSVDPGSVVALLGPNGAGKTTMVRILATLTSFDAGRATVAGFDVAARPRDVRRRISLVGQHAGLDHTQTGAENLGMLGRLRGLGRRAAIARRDELLRQFDLLDVANRRVSAYSGGMRRRLDLAAGLITRPDVVFLDEPTTGLDPRSRQEVWDVVEALATTGVAIVLTTQYLEEADRLAHMVVLLDGGRVVAQGTPEELKGRVGGSRLAMEAFDGPGFDAVTAALGSRAIRVDRRRLHVEARIECGAPQARRLLDEVDPDRGRIRDFSTRAVPLEEVFLTLTGLSANRTHGDAAHA